MCDQLLRWGRHHRVERDGDHPLQPVAVPGRLADAPQAVDRADEEGGERVGVGGCGDLAAPPRRLDGPEQQGRLSRDLVPQARAQHLVTGAHLSARVDEEAPLAVRIGGQSVRVATQQLAE